MQKCNYAPKRLHCKTYWPFESNMVIIFNFRKLNLAESWHLEKRSKLCYLSDGLTDLHKYGKMTQIASTNHPAVKNSNFENPRWPTAAILKKNP